MRTTSPRIDRDRPVSPRRSRVALGLLVVPACVLGLLPLPAPLSALVPARAQVPGPEVFVIPPKTAAELWEATDYLVRTGQAAQAVPYVKQFLASNLDDATLMRLRDRYGAGSFLALQDHPATRPFAAPVVDKLSEALRRHATNPDRIARAVAALTRTREEQDDAVDRLREAGPYAVPPILRALQQPSLPAEEHALLVRNLGRLDTPAVPPLIAALDAPEAAIAADAAEALARLGDPRAVVALTAAAHVGQAGPAAARAVQQLTGQSFATMPKSPTRLLADEARRYHTHQIQFPGDPVILWRWSDREKAPVPRTVSRSEAEGFFGQRAARAALAIDPTNVDAQVTLISLALDKAIERAGYDQFPAGDAANTLGTAVAAGPNVLGAVLRQAIKDGKTDLAAVAAAALGKVTDPSTLSARAPHHPLVEALSAPGRRVRLAAAKALIALNPRQPFAGSSRVVTTLAQFLSARPAPRAVVIDGNLARGNTVSSHLRTLSFDPIVARTGTDGFREAAESADVELVLVDIHQTEGAWSLHDILANLRADARTAAVPVYVYGPLDREPDLMSLRERFPGVKFLVTPASPAALADQLGVVGRPQPPSDAERAAYAREAVSLLAQIAARPGSPFERDLARVEPALAGALSHPDLSLAASNVLGDIALPDAQRGLADVLTDPSKPGPLRLNAAGQLAQSIQRFGPLVAADQEVKLLNAYDQATDPALRTALGTVVGALRPKAGATGLRLRQMPSNPAIGTAPAATPNNTPASSPEAAPSPSETPNEPSTPNSNPAPAPASAPAPAPNPPPGGEGRF